MDRQRIAQLAVASPLLSIVCLSLCPAWAGAYKCREPDGHISYQGTPCPLESNGAELTPSIAPPSGAIAPDISKKYTVEGQLKALETERRRAHKAREKGSTPSRRTRKQADAHDTARCAKHRAEAARWRREIRNGYLDRDQKEQELQMLKHHQALVERYCAPER